MQTTAVQAWHQNHRKQLLARIYASVILAKLLFSTRTRATISTKSTTPTGSQPEQWPNAVGRYTKTPRTPCCFCSAVHFDWTATFDSNIAPLFEISDTIRSSTVPPNATQWPNDIQNNVSHAHKKNEHVHMQFLPSGSTAAIIDASLPSPWTTKQLVSKRWTAYRMWWLWVRWLDSLADD